MALSKCLSSTCGRQPTSVYGIGTCQVLEPVVVISPSSKSHYFDRRNSNKPELVSSVDIQLTLIITQGKIIIPLNENHSLKDIRGLTVAVPCVRAKNAKIAFELRSIVPIAKVISRENDFYQIHLFLFINSKKDPVNFQNVSLYQ